MSALLRVYLAGPPYADPDTYRARAKVVLRLRDLTAVNPMDRDFRGRTAGNYLTCIDLYASAGVDLAAQPLVGVGSVCRRQSTLEIGRIMRTVAEHGIAIHGFGVKKEGIEMYGHHLASADSMAWSLWGRRVRLQGCTHTAKSCANCKTWALVWREGILRAAASAGHRTEQLEMEIA